MSISDSLTFLAVLAFGVLLGAVIGVLWSRSRGSTSPAVIDEWEARVTDQGVIRDGLDRLHDQLRDLEHQRVSWQGQLRQQVDDMRHSTDVLRRETQTLSTALRKPQVRGRWGELHLRRSVEIAGLVDQCDFSEQTRFDDGARRPDLVVHLSAGRSLVVDAKVPLDAFLDATGADDEEESQAHLARHARQLRRHADALAAKSYWDALDDSPEFVVLFVPGESFLSAALEADATLLEHAAERGVVLATPTTLIALLRTVALGWSQVRVAERTREVHALGRDLHERLGVMGAHLDKLGRSLRGSVEAYNRTVGSLESRVLVSARQFNDLGVTRRELPTVAPVEEAPRPLSAAELLDAVAEPRDPLPDLTHPTRHTPQSATGTDGESGHDSAWRP